MAVSKKPKLKPKPKASARAIQSKKAGKSLLQEKKRLIKQKTLRDEDVTVIEIRVRPPRSKLLARRISTFVNNWPRPPRQPDIDYADIADNDLTDTVKIRDNDGKNLPRTMDMDPNDRIPV